jgi:hypothetical protein
MHILSPETIFRVGLALIALFVIWTILKAVLKLTLRLFSWGCLALGVLVGLAWLTGLLT